MDKQVLPQATQLKNEDLERILKAQNSFFEALAIFSAVQLFLLIAIF